MRFQPKQVAIIGASGAIGNGFKQHLTDTMPQANIYDFSRHGGYTINYDDEESISEAAEFAAEAGPLDLVIVANGVLHDSDVTPEKSLRELSASNFQHVFHANTVTPALIAKYFLPKLNRQSMSVFAALSARVGSISDNRLGGWYAYRASKAALNMILKNAAIEIGRRNKQAIIVGLHPGTVDSALSKPFQSHVPEHKLFTPAFAVENLMKVIDGLTPEETGKCFAWDGQEVTP